MTTLGLSAGEAAVTGALAAGITTALSRGRSALAKPTGPAPGISVARVGLALGAGLVLWAATGWVAAGLWGAVGGWAAPALRARDRQRAGETTRLDAWASWVGLVQGQLAGQASLAEALAGACHRAPLALADEVGPLGEALAGAPLDEALASWAVAGSGSAELRQVAMVLQLAAAGSGGHLGQVLAQLGAQLRARAASARRIERERRRTRLAGRAAAGVALVWLVAGSRLDTSLFRVYAGPTGQVLLSVMLGIVAAGLAGLARLDKGLAC